MKVLVVIPCHLKSVRLPGKALLPLMGRPLIGWVWHRARILPYEVVIATDSPEIAAYVEGEGARVFLTSACATGSDRVAQLAKTRPDVDVVVNLQGDEPLFDPAGPVQLVEHLRSTSRPMATLATPLHGVEMWRRPHVVKVLVDGAGRACYFSRAPLPWVSPPSDDTHAIPAGVYHHVGIYAYRRAALLEFSRLPPSPWEQAEKLEQLRPLYHGWDIGVQWVPGHHAGVDTLEDLHRVETLLRQEVP